MKKKEKIKTIELSELEAEKIKACILMQAKSAEMRADKLRRKDKLTSHQTAELNQCEEMDKFYSSHAKKIKYHTEKA